MSVSLTGFRRLIANFLSWWLSELRALGHPISELLQRRSPALTLGVLERSWILRLHKGNRVKELGRVESGEGNKTDIGAIVKKAKLGHASLTVLLPKDRVLRKVLDLPAITEAELREALSFEIDRQTPFRPDDVYFDFRVLSRRPDTKRLAVELTTVPRGTVDTVLAEVQRWGLHPSRVDVAAEDLKRGSGINLLRGSGDQRGRSPMRMALTLLVILLAVGAVYIPVSQLAATDELLQSQVAEERKAADRTLGMRDELEQTVKAAQFLNERKKNVPSSLLVLNELTKAIPDNTWLLTLSQDKSQLKISGYSAAAAELISALDAVPLFKKPAFTSPIVQEPQRKLERFEISFEVDPDGGKKP
jgi:general secretion pathway protein L